MTASREVVEGRKKRGRAVDAAGPAGPRCHGRGDGSGRGAGVGRRGKEAHRRRGVGRRHGIGAVGPGDTVPRGNRAPATGAPTAGAPSETSGAAREEVGGKRRTNGSGHRQSDGSGGKRRGAVLCRHPAAGLGRDEKLRSGGSQEPLVLRAEVQLVWQGRRHPGGQRRHASRMGAGTPVERPRERPTAVSTMSVPGAWMVRGRPRSPTALPTRCGDALPRRTGGRRRPCGPPGRCPGAVPERCSGRPKGTPAGTRGDHKKRGKGDGRSSRRGRRGLAGSAIARSGAREGRATGGQVMLTAHERGAQEVAGGGKGETKRHRKGAGPVGQGMFRGTGWTCRLARALLRRGLEPCAAVNLGCFDGQGRVPFVATEGSCICNEPVRVAGLFLGRKKGMEITAASWVPLRGNLT